MNDEERGAAGWYPDVEVKRYWDGDEWTDQMVPLGWIDPIVDKRRRKVREPAGDEAVRQEPKVVARAGATTTTGPDSKSASAK